MIRLLITILLCLYSINSKAQIVQLRDKSTHQPLELVAIFDQSQHVTTISNMKGQADLKEFITCDSIIFRLIGYETKVYSYNQLQATDYKVYLEQNELSLDEVVVSATKWKQGRRETPSKISVLKPKEVNFLSPQTAADLMEMTGDVFVQKSQMGGGSPMIRGFATNRVLIAIDGVRMNNAIFRSGNIQNIISLDPFATNRAEVIFGPGSTIYGSDAIGGVMGFYTFDPVISHSEKELIKANATARYSSANNEKTGHIDFNLGYNNWASFSSITYSDFGDLKMGSNGPSEYLNHDYVIRENDQDIIVNNKNPQIQTPSAYNQINLLQKFKFMPSNTWQFNYGIHYSTTSDIPRYDRLIMRDDDDELKYGDWYYGPQKWLMNNLNIKHSANNQLFDNVHLIAAHQFFEESRHNRKIHTNNITRRTENVNAYNVNIDFEKHWNDGDRLFYGIEFIANHVGSTAHKENLLNGDISAASTRYPDGSKWMSAAIYSSYMKNFTEKTNLQAGLRYNYIYIDAEFDNAFFDFSFNDIRINTGAVTGSVGIIHNPSENWQLSTSLSSGFRAPNIDDVGKVFDSEPGAVVVPNPNIKPEYAVNAEVGAAVIVIKKWKLDFAAYYTQLYNAMVRRNFEFNGQDSIDYDEENSRVQAIQNAAHAYVYGIQAGVEYKWKNGFSASSRFNYQQGEEELDDGSFSPLRHAAPWFGTTHLSYEQKLLKIDLYAQYNGKIAFEDMPESELGKAYLYALNPEGNPYSPGWTTLSIKAQYAINSNTTLTAGIDNLSDKRYKTYSSGIAAGGRNYIISIRYSL